LFEVVISNANSKCQPRPLANMGIPYSQEARKKIRISRKTVDIGKWNLGRKHGEETNVWRTIATVSKIERVSGRLDLFSILDR